MKGALASVYAAPALRQALDDVPEAVEIGDADQDVEDRLGAEPRDGGAADVLERGRDRGERLAQLRGDLGVVRGPVGLGVDELDGAAHGGSPRAGAATGSQADASSRGNDTA